MSCPHCDELAERVAYLESELGVAHDADAIDHLCRALNLSPGPAEMLHTLYVAKGKLVTRWTLLETIPSRNPNRDPKIVDVYAVRIRKALGRDGIEVVRNQGWRLSAPALVHLSRIVTPPDTQSLIAG